MYIIGISAIGESAGSGKDEVADNLISMFTNLNITCTKYSMADTLKKVVKLVFHTEDSDVNTSAGKKAESKYGYSHTNRSLLQVVGTDLFRNYFDLNIWIANADRVLKKEYSDYDVVIIPDIRFPNEVEFIQSQGVLIGVDRKTKQSITENTHISEQPLMVHVDYSLDNNKCLKELFVNTQSLFMENLLSDFYNHRVSSHTI